MCRTIVIVLSVLTISVIFIACPNQGSGITTYERIVIDTYSPNDASFANTYIDLFDSNGDPDADDPWVGDDTSEAIASDDDSNPNYTDMARIDYTGGLISGTYYIRVRGEFDNVDDCYEIRVLSLNILDLLPPYDFTMLLDRPDAVDSVPPGDDDPVSSGGVPTNPVTIQLGNANRLSRSIDYEFSVPDIDWFKLVLP